MNDLWINVGFFGCICQNFFGIYVFLVLNLSLLNWFKILVLIFLKRLYYVVKFQIFLLYLVGKIKNKIKFNEKKNLLG